MVSGLGTPDSSVELVLVARAFHNWARAEGQTDRYMAEFFRALMSIWMGPIPADWKLKDALLNVK